MVADIRAVTICNLGTVIQGAISDESLSPGQGLIRCRGQLVIDGLITPAAGTVVELAYLRDERIVRVPRKLRVISSFADPFRDTTTVQIGDKLVWLFDKAPDPEAALDAPAFPDNPSAGDTYSQPLGYPEPTSGDPNVEAKVDYEFNGICWIPTNLGGTNNFKFSSSTISAAEQNPLRPVDEQLRAPVTIAAKTIAYKCLAGLGLASTGVIQLKNNFPEDQARITNGYVSTLEGLLSDEGYVGYLNANEVLVVVPVQPTSGLGPLIEEEDIVDIGPLGQGELSSAPSAFTIDNSSANDPALDPDPVVPVANDFTLAPKQEGSTFTVSYASFTQNAQFDNYRNLYGKVKVDVAAGQGCSVTASIANVFVEVNNDFEGTATFSYTVNDGTNTSNSATVSFEVNADPSQEDETTEGPSQAGIESSSTFGGRVEIPVNYRTDSGDFVITYESYPSSYREEEYGLYGELLQSIETKLENGAAAAGNVFQQWLEQGYSPANSRVRQTTVVKNIYDYSGKPTNPQSKQCAINGICEFGISLPPDPSEGDTLSFGECQYVFSGGSWEPSAEPGEGALTVVEPPVPTLADNMIDTSIQPGLIQTITEVFEHGYYISGAINWPRVNGLVPPLPTNVRLTEQSTVTFSRAYTNKGAEIDRSNTVVFKARYKTVEGQQFLAQQAELVQEGSSVDYASILDYSTTLIVDNVSSSISVARVTEDGVPVPTTGPTEPVMPRTWDPVNGYEEQREAWKEQNAQTAEQARSVSKRFLQFGYRYGVGLQVAPWVLPMYPLSPLYLNMRSVVGAFRANGISVAFSSDGILANCDALLVGGVGGTGVPWFPLPDGTTLPEAPAPVVDGEAVAPNSIAVPENFDPNSPGVVFSSLPSDEEDSFAVSLDPDGIFLSDPVSYRIFLGIRVGVAFDRLDWSLTPQIKDQALGVKTGLTVGREIKILVPAAAVTVAGGVPKVSTGIALQPAALNVVVAAEVPKVSIGAVVAVPSVGMDVAPAPGPVVPRESTVVSSPAVDVEMAAAVPAVSGGASVAVPVADVTVAAAVPTVSMVAPPLMKVLLYTGNASTNTQTGVGFEPGLVWTKRRTSSVADHAIYDYVQGTTKYWRSNQAAAQVTDANSLTAFSSDGFTLGSAAISNTNSASYVAWCLTKGGTSSSNTDGSITTTVYANSTAGYNIFTYTGTGANATIGHGLGASPELVFIRNLGAAQSTAVGGDFLANNEYIFLGTTGKASSGTVFQSYSSTTISVGSNSSVNGSGNSMLGYAFKSVAGNTDIGTYTGTGTTDQSITCGFAPQFVLIKVYSTTGSWMIFDNTRGVTLQLAMGENSVESTVDKVTLDANGFTVKANQNTNTNAATYVYLAIR